jgi:hypothetical protein
LRQVATILMKRPVGPSCLIWIKIARRAILAEPRCLWSRFQSGVYTPAQILGDSKLSAVICAGGALLPVAWKSRMVSTPSDASVAVRR